MQQAYVQAACWHWPSPGQRCPDALRSGCSRQEGKDPRGREGRLKELGSCGIQDKAVYAFPLVTRGQGALAWLGSLWLL